LAYKRATIPCRSAKNNAPFIQIYEQNVGRIVAHQYGSYIIFGKFVNLRNKKLIILGNNKYTRISAKIKFMHIYWDIQILKTIYSDEMVYVLFEQKLTLFIYHYHMPPQIFELKETPREIRKALFKGDTLNTENISSRTITSTLFSGTVTLTLKLKTGEVLVYE
jgi:hypothetical protein